MLSLLFVPSLFAATVSLEDASGNLDGKVVSTPTQLLIGGNVADMAPGHHYRVRVGLPDGTVQWARPTAGGRWSLALPYAMGTVDNTALQTISASLFDRTAGHYVDAEVASVIDLTPFDASMTSRTARQRDAWRFHVTPAGIDDFEDVVMDAVAASGPSLDERLAEAIPPGSDIAADAGGCDPTAGMDGGEWDTLWELALPLLEILLAPVPGAYAVLETIDNITDHAQVCFEGVYPVVEGVTAGPATFDLAPADGGLTADVTMGEIVADLEMSTSVALHLDLSDFEVDLFGVGVSASDFGIDIEDVTVGIEDLGLCDATYSSGGGASAEMGYTIGVPSSDRSTFGFRDDGAGSVTFPGPTIEASGVCGWGIFSDQLDESLDNVEGEITRAFSAALGMGQGQDSWVAVALTEAYVDMETSSVDVLTFEEAFSSVRGDAETGGSPEPGGLTWQGVSSVEGDGTLSDHEVCYTQDHSFAGIDDEDPDGNPYDLAVAVTAQTLNQALAAGADSERMSFVWIPSWNDLGLCSSAPKTADCDDAAVLDGTLLGSMYRPLAGIGTSGVSVQYVAPVAPFTAVELDPVGPVARGFFFLGSYRMQLVDVATGALVLEVAMGVTTDTFGVLLGDADDTYGYALPLTATYAVTHWGLRGWPSTLDPAADLSLFVGPMLDQATAALYDLPAPELEAPCGGGACTVVGGTTRAGDGTFYAWATIE